MTTALPRAHTHPTTRPLTSLSSLPPRAPKNTSTTQQKSRSALPTPARSPARSPQLRAIPRSALTSPLTERTEDPFAVAGFYTAEEGGFGWVRPADVPLGVEELAGAELGSGEGEGAGDGEEAEGEARKLEGEEELGVEECIRRVLTAEDRLGVLNFNLSLPQLSRTPSSSTPSPPSAPPSLSDPHPRPHPHPHPLLPTLSDLPDFPASLLTNQEQDPAPYTPLPDPSDPSDPLTRLSLSIQEDHALGPETDDALHLGFRERTRERETGKAWSYPDLVLLNATRSATSTIGQGMGGAGGPKSVAGRRAAVQPVQPLQPVQSQQERAQRPARAEHLHHHSQSQPLPPVEPHPSAATGLSLELFAPDPPTASAIGEKAGLKAGLGQGLREVGVREGWRVWALERVGRVVGLD